jgi:glycosyltransferase involved in cell wall biosynthesis
VRIRFITSTPPGIRRGSGTYIGIQVLAAALRGLGHAVEFETPRLRLPIYTAERLIFNHRLRRGSGFDLTVGFDLDGYSIAAGDPSHVASLKGVVADEMRFEQGLTRFTMGIQARRERLHVERAARVVTTSLYSAERARTLYSLPKLPAIVPELIDLRAWRRILEAHPATTSRFTILFAGRLYRRKRVGTLLKASALLRGRIPDLEVRIVGDGPRGANLRRMASSLRLEDTVSWLGDVPRAALAAEYNRADIFCLPSVQEGFGIVLLEAMAAGKPVVASRAAAIPEVAPCARLVEPDDPEALADAVDALYRSPEERAARAAEGARLVERYDAPRVAGLFLDAVAGITSPRA